MKLIEAIHEINLILHILVDNDQGMFYRILAAFRSKIQKITFSALSTRQSLVKGERLVRHEMRAVLLTKYILPIISE